ncbi:transforming growth factor-beta-induced protein ig-h3-like [Diaphorina citri]|uniref:Transforming growth factor-beta-induced protein ig-h3-like n=1 Tax=Diaphorina citri TaxID=121845 RepID=A0A3Q0JJL8_DIACI|nr:transforming growth factor-beta-induced protein ig-h3-like [Diaphorina citri]
MEAGLRNKYIRGQACIKSVLKHHIVPHTICTAAIPNRKRSTIDMNGEWLSLERDPSGSLVVGEKAHTEQPDLMATNGVVHIVNKVIQPKSVIWIDFAAHVGTFSNFLPSPGVLKHHIVPHTICTAAIPNRKRSTIDMNGEWLSLERDPSGSLVVGDKAHTEQPDLMATNGVVHIVNKVIQPKSAQPTSQILSQSNHTSWLDLVQKANLLDMIDQTPNITMFVPSEESLNEPATKQKLDAMSPETLKDVILYHTATPKVCSCEMENDMVVNSTLPGQRLQINVFNNVSNGPSTLAPGCPRRSLEPPAYLGYV